MTSYTELAKTGVIVLVSMMILLTSFTPLALASLYSPDSYDLWNTIEEFEEVSTIRALLIKEDWVDESVSINELDYVLVLAQQLSREFFSTVPPALTLAVISVESGFRQDLIDFSDDSGLMQIIPQFHKDRISKYLYDENVDIFDPRVNVMTGVDYLAEMLEYCDGDISAALRCYNEGPKGRKRFEESGPSPYVEMVLERMDAINDILGRRR